jgi:hypothetical protein
MFMAEDRAPNPKRILVVNDTEEIVELFLDILEGMGHEAVATSFAPDDLAEVKKVEPDLVILDLMIGAEAQGWSPTDWHGPCGRGQYEQRAAGGGLGRQGARSTPTASDPRERTVGAGQGLQRTDQGADQRQDG